MAYKNKIDKLKSKQIESLLEYMKLSCDLDEDTYNYLSRWYKDLLEYQTSNIICFKMNKNDAGRNAIGSFKVLVDKIYALQENKE